MINSFISHCPFRVVVVTRHYNIPVSGGQRPQLTKYPPIGYNCITISSSGGGFAAERNWTREQIEAITCSANDILVSAGAGSGKTAVLTERIIRRLCDESNPVDITRMLIVTFTNAATEELRDRVAVALRARLAAEPENRRLRRQLMLLPSAHIYTISSFCLGIVRANLSAL